MCGNSIFAGTLFDGNKHGDIYLSTNNGYNWTTVFSGLPKDSSSSVWSFAISPTGTGDTNIFAGTNDGIYLSTNKGTSWTSVSSGLPRNFTIYALAIILNEEGDTSLFAGTSYGVWMYPFSKKIPLIGLNKYVLEFYSLVTDVETDSISITNNSHVPLVIDSVYTKTKWFTVGYSHGAISNGDTVSLYISFVPDSANIYSDTLYIVSNSVYPLTKVPLSGQLSVTSIRQNNSIIPKGFEISQNYPNPFNPSTTIPFTIPSSQMVELKVYDMLGQEVAELINEYRQAGSYSAQLNASHLASGIYFYKLKAGNFVQTKKLILLK